MKETFSTSSTKPNRCTTISHRQRPRTNCQHSIVCRVLIPIWMTMSEASLPSIKDFKYKTNNQKLITNILRRIINKSNSRICSKTHIQLWSSNQLWQKTKDTNNPNTKDKKVHRNYPISKSYQFLELWEDKTTAIRNLLRCRKVINNWTWKTNYCKNNKRSKSIGRWMTHTSLTKAQDFHKIRMEVNIFRIRRKSLKTSTHR